MRISEKRLKEIENRHFERKARGRSFDPDPEALSDFEELFKAVVAHQDDDRDSFLEMAARFAVAMMAQGVLPPTAIGQCAVALARDVFKQVDTGGER